MSEGWINGGFFVLEPGIFDYIPGDVDWAREPLEQPRRGRPARRVLPRRVLAVHGHDARQDAAQLDVGQRRSALEALELVTEPSVTETTIDGVVVFTPTPIVDDRGFFSRTLDLAWCRAPASRRRSSTTTSRARRAACCAVCTCAPERGEAKLVRCARGSRRRPRRRHAAVVADVPPRRAHRARRRRSSHHLYLPAVRRPRLPGRVRRRRRLLPALPPVRGRRRPVDRVGRPDARAGLADPAADPVSAATPTAPPLDERRPGAAVRPHVTA